MLLNIINKSQFLQNIYVSLQSAIHPVILHNTGKIEIIKKALHQISIEQVKGGYFEFGIYEGTSLLAAVKSYKSIQSIKSIKFYKKVFHRKFYGFDSFDDGFKYHDSTEKHQFFAEGDFKSSYKKCKKRFKKYKNVELIKGYFEDSIQGEKLSEMFPGEKCAIVFIDCDLKKPASIALEYVKEYLQEGSVIILDDYFAYKGKVELGTCGALVKFLKENKNIKVREFFKYGYTGCSFIVTNIKKTNKNV